MTFDAGTLTEIVLAAGALAAAYAVPLALAKRARAADKERDTADKERDTLSSWAELNEALQAEIRRATGEVARQRADSQQELAQQRDDYQRELGALRADYQAQLDAAKRRITELETEVATLQRALRGRGP